MKIGDYYIESVGGTHDADPKFCGFVGRAGNLREKRPQIFAEQWEAQEVARNFIEKMQKEHFPHTKLVLDNDATESENLVAEIFVWQARSEDEVDDDVAVFGLEPKKGGR